ncbi:hypothetical protein SRABI76_00937 [Microbacterium oxydans]|nr:hypothetical protein SRABI76_00937 [Microbacterium oxydans]
MIVRPSVQSQAVGDGSDVQRTVGSAVSALRAAGRNRHADSLWPAPSDPTSPGPRTP